MEGKQDAVRHAGVVSDISGNIVCVTILQFSACSSCQARNLCRISESKEKTVQVTVDDPDAYSLGQQVVVMGSEKQGMKAVLMAFGIPLVLLMAGLVTVLAVWSDEKLAALVCLAVLVPYYLVLFLCRDRIRKEFQFTIAR